MSEAEDSKGNVTLLDQLRHQLGEAVDGGLGAELRHYIAEFTASQDLNWIDLAVWRATRSGSPLPPVIQGLAARAAHARLLGAGSRNNVARAFKQHVDEVAMPLMASFTGLGHTRGEAAKRTANAMHATHGYSPTASTLEIKFATYLKSAQAASRLIERLERESSEYPEGTRLLDAELKKLPQRAEGKRR